MSEERINEILYRLDREAIRARRTGFSPDLAPTVRTSGPIVKRPEYLGRKRVAVPIRSVRYTRSDKSNGYRPIPEPIGPSRDYRGGYVGTGR